MVCYVYHKGEGGKGSNEVASLLSNYIETLWGGLDVDGRTILEWTLKR